MTTRDGSDDDGNPYRPPEARIDEALPFSDPAQQTCWRDGASLVVLRDAPLPARCVKCNADAADGVRMRVFRWVTPWAYAPLLAIPATAMLAPLVPDAHRDWLLACFPVAFLAALIANLVLRRSARHAVALCEPHRRHRARRRGMAVASLLAGLVSPFLQHGLAPMFLLCTSAVVVWFSGEDLSPLRIDGRYSRFRRCGEALLHSLPMLPEYRLHYLKRRRDSR